MSPDEKNAAAQLVKVAATLSYSGPLPPPEALQRYDQILPGSANRIIKMAESQHEHRQKPEKTVVESNAFSQKVGLILGFVVAMTAIVGGIWLAGEGKSGSGVTAIIAALAALVGVFVYGKIEQRRELAEKAKAFSPPEQSDE